MLTLVGQNFTRVVLQGCRVGPGPWAGVRNFSLATILANGSLFWVNGWLAGQAWNALAVDLDQLLLIVVAVLRNC